MEASEAADSDVGGDLEDATRLENKRYLVKVELEVQTLSATFSSYLERHVKTKTFG